MRRVCALGLVMGSAALATSVEEAVVAGVDQGIKAEAKEAEATATKAKQEVEAKAHREDNR